MISTTSNPEHHFATLKRIKGATRQPLDFRSPGTSSLNLRAGVIIAGNIGRVYHFWRNFENFSEHWPGIVSVVNTGPRASRWRIKAGISMLEWDIAITSMKQNKYISWCSTGGSLTTSGQAVFRALSAAETAVEVTIYQCEPSPGLLEAIRLELSRGLEGKLQYILECIKSDIEGKPDSPIMYTCLA